VYVKSASLNRRKYSNTFRYVPADSVTRKDTQTFPTS